MHGFTEVGSDAINQFIRLQRQEKIHIETADDVDLISYTTRRELIIAGLSSTTDVRTQRAM